MLREAGGQPRKIATTWPESWMMKSDKQKILERNGCVFRGQELLDNHEIDAEKECYCGRPKKESSVTSE